MKILIFYFLLLATFQAFAKDMFVKSLKAPVLDKAQNGSKTILTLERGAQVNVLGNENTFIQVEATKIKGFINKLFLSDSPPTGSNSLLNKDVDISSKARKRASGFTSAAAARGLKEDSDDVFKELGLPNIEDLKKMENLVIKNDVGLTFLQDEKAKIQ